MFGFNKKKSKTPPAEKSESTGEPLSQEKSDKAGLFSRLTSGLNRTRANITDGIATLILGNKKIDADIIEEIETLLLTADIGIDATDTIISDLTQRLKRDQLQNSDALLQALREDMLKILQPCEQVASMQNEQGPFVLLMVGVNGAGKTTTIGKLSKRLQAQGQKVMLAAGDTFRAAAVEQLQEWGKRNNIPVVAQQTGADSASVIFDALQAAKARDMNVLIADTAGRLHTQSNLMEELKKVTRVIKKIDQHAPHEVMLVLDASIGQNAVNQARQFSEAVGVTGIALTKLDGTAKGGVIFAIAKQLGIPIRFIGVGEGIDDLRPFNASEFVDALLQRQVDPNQS